MISRHSLAAQQAFTFEAVSGWQAAELGPVAALTGIVMAKVEKGAAQSIAADIRILFMCITPTQVFN
jgi:hypothetical protein